MNTAWNKGNDIMGMSEEYLTLLVLLEVAVLLIAIGLVGLHFRQADRCGRLGQVALVINLVGGLLFLFGVLTPVFGGTEVWSLGVGLLTLIIGSLLTGLASLRARVFPRLAGIMLMAASLMLLFFDAQGGPAAGAAIPFGAVWLVLGYLILTSGRITPVRTD